MLKFNYTLKKNLILFMALGISEVYAIRGGIILEVHHGCKVVVKYNNTTNLCSVGIIVGHFNQKEKIIKGVPIEKVLTVIYQNLGRHPLFFKHLSAWM